MKPDPRIPQAYKFCPTDLQKTRQEKRSNFRKENLLAISVLNYEAWLEDLQMSLGPLIFAEDPEQATE